MSEDESTTSFGAPASGLARVLGIGVDAADDEVTPGLARRKLLLAILDGPPPQAATDARAHDDPAGGASSDALSSDAKRALGEVLLDEDTELDVFKAIKDYAKGLGDRQESQTERGVLLVVYFAAIASALVFHGEKITTHSQPDLAAFLDRLAGSDWVPGDLAQLFIRAHKLCQE